MMKVGSWTKIPPPLPGPLMAPLQGILLHAAAAAAVRQMQRRRRQQLAASRAAGAAQRRRGIRMHMGTRGGGGGTRGPCLLGWWIARLRCRCKRPLRPSSSGCALL